MHLASSYPAQQSSIQTSWGQTEKSTLQRWRQDDRMIEVEKVHYVQYF